MGILDVIIAPIKDVIRGLEKPVKVVEHVFGEAIELVKEVVEAFEEMIVELTKLFNASEIEMLFLNPFKTAALDAIGSIEKLFLLIAQVADISADGVEEEVMAGIRDSYSVMRNSLAEFKTIMLRVLVDLEDAGSSVVAEVEHGFVRIAAAIESLPTEMKLLVKKVATEFKVVADKGMAVVPEFAELAEKGASSAAAAVRRVGTMAVDDFDSLEKSIHDRIANESAQVDLFTILLAGLILALVVGIFFITKSFIVVGIVVAFIVVVALVWTVVQHFIG